MPKTLFEASLRFRVVEYPDGQVGLEGQVLTDELSVDPDQPGVNLSVAALLALTAYGRFDTGLLIKDMEVRFGVDASGLRKEDRDAAEG